MDLQLAFGSLGDLECKVELCEVPVSLQSLRQLALLVSVNLSAVHIPPFSGYYTARQLTIRHVSTHEDRITQVRANVFGRCPKLDFISFIFANLARLASMGWPLVLLFTGRR